MHPSYLIDYIDKIKVDTTNDVDLLSSSIKEIQDKMEFYHGKDLEWYLTHVIANARLYKHSLLQLQKRLEKEINASQQI